MADLLLHRVYLALRVGLVRGAGSGFSIRGTAIKCALKILSRKSISSGYQSQNCALYESDDCRSILDLPLPSWRLLSAKLLAVDAGPDIVPFVAQPAAPAPTLTDPYLQLRDAQRHLAKAKSTIQSYRYQLRSQARKVVKINTKQVACHAHRRDPSLPVPLDIDRGKSGRIRPRGLLALGIRKALGGYVSGTDICGIMMDPLITRWNVVAAELRVHMCHLGSSRRLHSLNVGFKAEDGAWQTAVFVLQGDATNSNVFMNSKLHILRCFGDYHSVVHDKVAHQ